MNKVHILIEGYAHPGEGETYIASPTTTLIEAGDKKILVDPGTNAKLLLEALSKLNLKPENIDLIFLTHYHPDHFLNLSLFPGTDVYDGTLIWREDQEIPHRGVIAGTDIEVLPTPGHGAEHASLLVNTEEGMVCIAADLFWWEDGKQKSDTQDELINLADPFATDLQALKNSRKLVLEKADVIIPGHGRSFKNPTKN